MKYDEVIRDPRFRDGAWLSVMYDGLGGKLSSPNIVQVEDAKNWKDKWAAASNQVYDFEFVKVTPEPMPVTIRLEAYINVYPVKLEIYTTRDAADKYALDGRLGCIKIDVDFPEGRLDP